MKKIVLVLLLSYINVTSLMGQQVVKPDSGETVYEQPPALSAIKKADLKRDIFALASDDMRGRRAGTLDALRAAAWVAEQARKAGLQPAGEDSTYFQFFSLQRSTVDERSTLSINDQKVDLWTDAWVTSPVEADLDDQVTWLNTLPDSTASLKGEIIAMNLKAPDKEPAPNMSLWAFRYGLSAIRRQSEALKKRGAKAVVLVADSTVAPALPYLALTFKKGSYDLTKKKSDNASMPVILAGQKWKEQLRQDQAHVSAHILVDHFSYPSANVVAKAPGSDERLSNEYVLFSGHHDHEGVGPMPVKGDSIWNGADDNASTSVALLAIGRAWVKAPGKRSALFVWHGAEERGLFGSRYFVRHPTVPKKSIVAVLNGDLIGRNAPDSAALLGAIPPHRNSRDLVRAAMKSNQHLTHFKVDTTWDESSHPEHWYFRSDHLPYARADIPAIFFTTLLHPDYHTPKDEADRINIDKLAEMTKWMYTTGWNISNRNTPPALIEKAN